MKKWLIVLGALTLVGCSDGDVKEESEADEKQETEEVETVEETNTTPTSTQTPVQTISEEDKLTSDSILGMLYIEDVEEALQGYIQINQFFSEAKGSLNDLRGETLIALINEEQEKLMAIKSPTLYDEEYLNRLEGYTEAMLLSYDALVNLINTTSNYNKGLVSDDSFGLIESAYDNSVNVVDTIRDYAIEYHNANYAE